MLATHNPTLRLRSTCTAVHVSAYFAISFRIMTSTSFSFFNYMYVRRTVSYKANLQKANTKFRATMGPPANAFWMVFFWWAESDQILRAYWELVDQFLSLHAFIPRPRLWRGATGNKKVIGVCSTQKRFGKSAFFCK